MDLLKLVGLRPMRIGGQDIRDEIAILTDDNVFSHRRNLLTILEFSWKTPGTPPRA
jgi:hypothetical protein